MRKGTGNAEHEGLDNGDCLGTGKWVSIAETGKSLVVNGGK